MGLPGGAHAKEADERFVVQCDPYFGLKKCNGGRDPECSARYTCMEWTWRRHSEFMGWSMREEFCNMTASVPESIYDGISPENPLSNLKVFDI